MMRGNGRARSSCLVITLLAATFTWGQPANPSGSPPAAAAKPPVDAAEALSIVTGVSVIETPLTGVLSDLAEKTGATFLVDHRSLDEIGLLAEDVLVTLELSGKPLRTLLRYVCRQADLSFTVKENVIMITSMENAEYSMVTKVYRRKPFNDSEIDLIQSLIAPDTWDLYGGPGNIQRFGNSLIISNEYRLHEEIKNLLEGLDRLMRQRRENQSLPSSISLGESASQEKAIEALLHKRYHFKDQSGEVPLSSWIDMIRKTTRQSVLVDRISLEDYGIATDDPVRVTPGLMSLRLQMQHTLNPLDLDFHIRDGIIHIASMDTCREETVTRLYPTDGFIADLPRRDDWDIPIDWLIEGSSIPTQGVALIKGLDAEYGKRSSSQIVRAITTLIASDTWEEVGGMGVAVPLPQHQCLMISNSQLVHTDVVELISKLREIDQSSASEFPDVETLGKQTVSVAFRIKDKKEETEQIGQMIELVTESVDSELWQSGGASISAARSQIVVKAPVETVQRVAGYLEGIGAIDLDAQTGFGAMSSPVGASGFFRIEE